MRILVVSNLYPPHYIGGYELRCRDIVAGLTERGHEVYVLTGRFGVDHDVVEGNVYRWLPVFVYEYTKVPSDGIPRQFIKAARAISRVRHLIRKHNIDLVYISKVQGFQEPVITAFASSGVPAVWDISDQWLTTFGEGPWFSYWNRRPDHKYLSVPKAAVERIVSRIVPVSYRNMNLHRACYTSRFLCDYHARLGVPTDEAAVIHCGCPEMFFNKVEKKSPNIPFRFLYAGQFIEGKGVHTIVEAAGRVVRNHPDLDFTIDLIGHGVPEYEALLSRVIVENNLQERITFLGKRTREEMPATYHKYDTLIFSSIWDEAFALTPLEAMASGLPVISTATGGNAEIIEEGNTALEFEAGDSFQLARQMQRLMTDKPLWKHLRENAARIVSRKFTVTHMVDAVEQYLQETLRRARKGNEYPTPETGTIVRNAARCSSKEIPNSGVPQHSFGWCEQGDL